MEHWVKTGRISCLKYCVESVRIENYSSPYFPAFRLNTDRYGVSLRIQSKCGKIQTRITQNTDTFHAMNLFNLLFGCP